MAKKKRTTDTSFTDIAGTLKVFSDPTRLAILDSLSDGIQCNCILKKDLGLPMNLISHHLKVLKDAGLIRSQRDSGDARWIYYEIIPEKLAEMRNSICLAMDIRKLKPRSSSCGPETCCDSGALQDNRRAKNPKRRNK